ncbi:LytTR family DNA-binding domain-containing protein [Erysipelothrix urinaevulpis]|uniref:LytR/AlgR family response regulator transcription factor n=1 Tax=Erysipelothrix urinaevulpis TaxID=2683717 RepID=UPI00135740D8|nr:LytTR family DNA-binding domain-containing protein [Erysipelothrix urinaevulpis]
MFRCLVVDANESTRNRLVKALSKYSFLTIEKCVYNTVNTIEMVDKMSNVDLVFLDLERLDTEELNLIKTLNHQGKPAEIIFMMDDDDSALKAFSLNNLKYLLKPIDEKKLDALIIDELKAYMSSMLEYKQKYNKIKAKLETLETPERLNKITVCVQGKLIPVDFSEIIYVTIENGDTVLRTQDNKYYLSQTLQEIYDKLSVKNFFRCHKSYIINTNYIDSIEPWLNYTFNLKLNYIDETIPVSRSNVKQFKRMMNIE